MYAVEFKIPETVLTLPYLLKYKGIIVIIITFIANIQFTAVAKQIIVNIIFFVPKTNKIKSATKEMKKNTVEVCNSFFNFLFKALAKYAPVTFIIGKNIVIKTEIFVVTLKLLFKKTGIH